MEKSKKISFTSIAIIVLAILLTVSLSMGGTLAWFANQNSGGTTLTMGNAVGVAQVASGGTANSDKLSFTFNTGANGELMLPGVQVDPDVRALIAKSNTNVILRAVVTFEITVDPAVRTLLENADYKIDAGGFMVVPSSVAGLITSTDPVTKELGTLSLMYQKFFAQLQESALFNGWVYKESNVEQTENTGNSGTGKYASTKYYLSGATWQQDTPIHVIRDAGPDRTQATTSAGDDEDAAVLYNAFYFRGWSSYTDTSTTTPNVTDFGLAALSDGTGAEAVYKGLDGWYANIYTNYSLTGTRYLTGGRQYYNSRSAAVAGTGKTVEVVDPTSPNDYSNQVIDGVWNAANSQYDKVEDQLNTVLNKSTVGSGAAYTTRDKDSWRTSGVQQAEEDMMAVLNTSSGTAKIPLFTKSFRLPTDWTQDAFADRSMRMNVTFQVMQSDYLASGQSHHVSVELAESRFDDVTVWATTEHVEANSSLVYGQPYIKNAANLPDFNNPGFWNDTYPG